MASVALLAACGEPTPPPSPEAPDEARTGLGVAPGGDRARSPALTPRVEVPAATGAAALDDAAEPAATEGPARRPTNPALAIVDERLVGVHALADDFPWGKGEDGNWRGTGSPDPESLRTVPDAKILATARGDEGSTDDRLSAIVSAARRHLPGALDVASAVLFDASQPRLSRQVALSALVEHGGPEAQSLMWRAFQDSDERIRGQAVWAITLYGTAEAKRVITAALADPAPGVQGAAILALTAIRNDEVFIRSVLERTIRSPKQQVYQEAAYVLGAIADARAIKALSDELDLSADDQLKRRTLKHALRAAHQKRAAAGAIGFPAK